MGRGPYVTVVIIDSDHGRRWSQHCHHRRSVVVKSTSTVVIIVVSSSSLSEIMRLRASSLPSKAGVVIVRHRQSAIREEGSADCRAAVNYQNDGSIEVDLCAVVAVVAVVALVRSLPVAQQVGVNGSD